MIGLGLHLHPAAVDRRPPLRAPSLPPRAGGYTITEVLCVVAIFVVLVALLVPAVSGLKQRARDTVCLGRVRDLGMATMLYHDENGRYPDPFHGSGGLQPGPLSPITAALPAGVTLPAVGPVLPQNVNAGLLNAVRQQLNFPQIGRKTAAGDLPPVVQCPTLEDVDDARGPLATADGQDAVFYTGYVYAGRLGEAPHYQLIAGVLQPGDGGGIVPAPAVALPPVVSIPVAAAPVGGSAGLPGTLARLPFGAVPVDVGVLLKPWRAARLRSGEPAVLWADDVHAADAPGGVAAGAGRLWHFAHARPRAVSGPVPLTYQKAADCRGQHRAFTDGHAEWVNGEDLGLDADAAGDPGATASYRLGLGFWWF